MGANSTQALGITLFLVAFTVMAAAMAMGGNLPLLLVSIAILAASAGIFRKAKPWEDIEQ
jgi:hypothetical protein